MKRLLVVAVVVCLTSMATVKAQSAVGMGPGMIYHTNYNGAIKYFAKGVKIGTMVWWCLATAGAGVYITPVVFDEPYVDVRGKLHLPIGTILFDEYDNEVTDVVSGIVIGF